MSMLAEKRRKQTYILNPRSTSWTSDSNKFGQKMLEKMGWTPGKGLGAREQGMVEAIRIKHKNDSKGLGSEKQTEEWIKTQEEFNLLLNGLNCDKSETKLEINSLEKKSKSLRSRVHYQKFTRGKDLSRYSAKDLHCILGTNTENNVLNEEEKSLNDLNYIEVKSKKSFKRKLAEHSEDDDSVLEKEIDITQNEILKEDEVKIKKKKKKRNVLN